jgi:uncharacterized membrane protein
MAVCASLCVVSLGIASVFWALGATLVMPFAWIELVALCVACVCYARHANDRERIALSDGCLQVEHQHGERVDRVTFWPGWVSVTHAPGGEDLIELAGQGHRVEIGRYVRPESRDALARDLRLALRRAMVPPAQER